MTETRAVSRATAYGVMGLTTVIWASSFAGIRHMLDRMQVMHFTALRLAIGVAGLVALGAIAGLRRPHKADVPRMIAAGLCGFTLYHVSLNYGAARITAGQTALVVSTIPIWTAFAAWRALGEEVERRHWIGLAVSLLGIGVMSLTRSDLNIPIGAVFVLLATFGGAANFVMQKSLVERYRPLDLTVYCALAGTVPLVLWLLTQTAALGALTGTDWALMAYLGVGPITMGYWLSTIALKALPAYRTSQFILLIPPIAMLIAWLALGEVPTLRTAVGGLVVLAGVFITTPRRTNGSV